ncbi:hypothetical protein Ahy_B06g085551 [Arachis hypogaea]|uniref:Sugar phosphate transporter domain-containing protein n=1 Tax=Arachis hypogaea TaxID=3818 RepID=A0A444YUW6_ARAHY|nr:hypothetical protein Ahy_B06g085551 [Arachis hypogaea]
MSSIRIEASKQHYTTTFLVVGYALCSSLLAIINKYAITQFNYPGLLTALQYLTSALGVYLLAKLGFLHHDPFTLDTAKRFFPAALVFFLAIFTNTNLLRHANVDTFIVFRSLTPLLVALADTVFRHQPCPSKLTFFSLVVILAGAVGVEHLGFCFVQQFVVSHDCALVLVFDALRSGSGSLFDPSALAAVGLSCVFGLAISFFGFAARKAVSATAFTVTGVVNKFLTVAINVLIWDKHASPFGLLCLLFTIVGGVLYQQSVTGPAPVQRDTTVDVEKNTGDYDDDGDDLEAERLLKVVKGSILTHNKENMEARRTDQTMTMVGVRFCLPKRPFRNGYK